MGSAAREELARHVDLAQIDKLAQTVQLVIVEVQATGARTPQVRVLVVLVTNPEAGVRNRVVAARRVGGLGMGVVQRVDGDRMNTPQELGMTSLRNQKPPLKSARPRYVLAEADALDSIVLSGSLITRSNVGSMRVRSGLRQRLRSNGRRRSVEARANSIPKSLNESAQQFLRRSEPHECGNGSQPGTKLLNVSGSGMPVELVIRC